MMARAMKDSGIEWIGEIPQEWEVDRLQHHLVEIKEQNCPLKTDNVLSLTIESGVIPYEEKGNQGNKAKENHEEYKLAFPNTLVVNSMNIIIGAVGISKYYGCVSPVYYVFKNENNSDLKYIYYLFTNVGFQKEMRKYAKGILEIRLRISASDMLKLSVPNPDLATQSRIAAFLDRKCAEIDRVAAETEKTIEEYKALKQSIITEAVTKGVRSKRPMKDSGIEWIGEIPVEWRITQLRHCASIVAGVTLGKKYPGDTILVEMPYLRVANVQDGYVDLSEVTTIQVTPGEAEKYKLHIGDVLMTEGGDRDKLGRGCVWNGEIDPCLHQNHVFAVEVKKELLSSYFLESLTASKIGRDYFDVTAIKTTNLACTTSSKVMSFQIPLPCVTEQEEIVSFIRDKVTAIDQLISRKRQYLTELETYKKSLIYEYVTGKKEVPV